LLEGTKDNNNKEAKNFKHRNKQQRLREMPFSTNLQRKRLEEEPNTKDLKTLEMNYKYKNKKKEPDSRSVMNF